jgi:sugar O-acyltransferase (sialic acid O-acetyltransferase NeuD family)
MINIIGSGGHAKVCRPIATGVGGIGYFIAIGNNKDRRKESKKYTQYATLIHGYARTDHDISVREGTVVLEGAVIQAGCAIGTHVIINANATVCHDCTIGDFAHIAPGAVLCGNVTVGEGALVGANSTCLPGSIIEPWATIPAGSVIK